MQEQHNGFYTIMNMKWSNESDAQPHFVDIWLLPTNLTYADKTELAEFNNNFGEKCCFKD